MSGPALFAVRQSGDTVVVTPKHSLSEFDLVGEDAEISKLLGSIAKLGCRHVVLDLAACDYCGSSALSFFTRLYLQSRKRGGEFAFCNVSPHQHEVLHLARFDMLWPVYESLEDALAGLAMSQNAVTWIVAADRGTARFFEQPAGSDGRLHEVTTLIHPESRQKLSETVTDGQGFYRGGTAGEALRAGEPTDDHRHCTARDFSREVATYLDAARQQHRFQRLILMAAPLFLGTLRKALTSATRKLVTLEIDRDYARLDEGVIRHRIQELAQCS